MPNNNEHHNALIARACQEGWTRGHGWQSDLYRIGHERGYGELAELRESLQFSLPRPDAWRISIEGPDDHWSYPVVVLEFLEIEVTSGITAAKHDLYEFLWDIFDATHYFHLRIWHMDRFGVVRPYLTNSTHHPMVFGMTANWRA